MTATAPRMVVIGVGNPWRRDDGAGPAVATALRARLARSHPGAGRGRTGVVRDGGEDRSVEVVELDGEAARLVDAWDGADLTVVVDAVRTGAVSGTVHLLDTGGPTGIGGHTGQGTSSHGLGVAEAVELARALDRLPRRLVLVGIEGADFGPGSDLTANVAAAVEPATQLVADLIDEAAPNATEPATQPVADVVEERV